MNDWKKRAAERRDARHGGPVKTISAPSKKDRKRWCRGKKGIEHKLKAVKYEDVKGAWTFTSGRKISREDWWLLICVECGKELEAYMPVQFYKTKRPEWVPSDP